ncbi:hypothetical protein ONS95_000513 [Cadophora gregata]|uniref:uncharacterized protein n=1 Tax=Cadophora gregata TaxID=51156 RepID=UPI0026DB7BDF|nr:uncharacterized protein ONS95_000513 [Cadophora gregata]KAK0128547.1 hypothetical protein ONS95_000513 [Cadophora gregata]
MAYGLPDNGSQDMAVEGDFYCQRRLSLNSLAHVTHSLSTLAAVLDITFKATVRRPSKKLCSLVNINNLRRPFRFSTPQYNFEYWLHEMDMNLATQAPRPIAVVTPPMAAVTDQVPPSPRRFTISTFPAISPRTRKNGGNGQCTHITTTRLYTEDFRCAQCLNLGSFGWLYRCTQDRELLLEEDIERGCEEKLDKFCDILPRSISPRTRSALARLDKLSFLTEISDDAMKHYTPDQLKTVLAQRAHLLDTVSQPDYTDFPESFFSNRPLPTPYPSQPPGLLISAGLPTSNTGLLKPWFPLQGGECQFKCCHFCRPSMKERSFLSLNGIANGDIPATTITGFGFHLQRKRPVALVKHVKNLGLRPNPPPRLPPRPDDSADSQSLPPSPTVSPKRRKKVKRLPTYLGLGIVPSEATHPSTLPTYTSPTPPSPLLPSTPKFANLPQFPSNNTSSATESGTGINLPCSTTSILSSFELGNLSSLPSSEIPHRRHPYSQSASNSESAQRIHTLATVTPLPPPTPSEQYSNMSSNMAGISRSLGVVRRQTGHISEYIAGTGTESEKEQEEDPYSLDIDMDVDTDVGEGEITASRPLTSMETGELIQGEFGRAPLDVKDGVALTEESVELHVPDIITQF